MTDAKAVRFAAVLVVLAGYILVFRAGEARIAARFAENAELAARLESGRRLVANGAAYEHERSRLQSVLRNANGAERYGILFPAFLRRASSVAAAHHTIVTTVTAGGAPPPRNETTPADATAFETTAFELSVEGRYADVLATVRALSASPRVLASVEIVALARKDAGAADSSLTASLRVTLHRLAAPEPGRSSHPSDDRARRV
ncbi:MAG TPA: hypothetical protein VK669_00795 [Candidatus Limnocylindrales bacterium]|nr:hypothetical protein [Candidatus Limnocylindrales bacterium]